MTFYAVVLEHYNPCGHTFPYATAPAYLQAYRLTASLFFNFLYFHTVASFDYVVLPAGSFGQDLFRAITLHEFTITFLLCAFCLYVHESIPLQ